MSSAHTLKAVIVSRLPPCCLRSCTKLWQVMVLDQKTFQLEQVKDKRCKYLHLIKTELIFSMSLCKWDRAAGRRAVRIMCSPCGVNA